MNIEEHKIRREYNPYNNNNNNNKTNKLRKKNTQERYTTCRNRYIGRNG